MKYEIFFHKSRIRFTHLFYYVQCFFKFFIKNIDKNGIL